MKHVSWVLSVIAAFIAGTMFRSPATHAQKEMTVSRIVTVDYMKVKPGQREDYIRIERNLWKPAHELLVREKKLQSWSLYEVKRLPLSNPDAAVTADYEFVTFTIHDKSREHARYEGTALMTVHPDKTLDAIMRRTRQARDLLRRDEWTLVDEVR
jgi:hypothetical protein